MNDRKITIAYEGDPAAIAVLYDDIAPRTAEAMWQALHEPVTMLAIHAMYAGPEMMVDLPESARVFDPDSLPPENQQVIPVPGDLQWYYQRPFQMGGLPHEMWEIGLFYAGGARTLGPLGWTPVSIWGRIIEGLEEFAKASSETRIHGARMLRIARLEG